MSENNNYAGFWLRFLAMLLDITTLLPLFAINYWLGEKYRLYELYIFVPHMIFLIWYNVYLVKRFGGTPGKLVLGLRIKNLDGTEANSKTASLRYSVQFLFELLGSLVIVIALSRLTDDEFNSSQRAKELLNRLPGWYDIFVWASNIWFYGELIVMFLNEKRRSLHDYMAGTVVVKHLESV